MNLNLQIYHEPKIVYGYGDLLDIGDNFIIQ